MISGVVTGDRQAVIHLIVRGPAGQEQEIDGETCCFLLTAQRHYV
jgi:hypothetical protein